MSEPLEVVVICGTGMVCETIADALECDSINVKLRACSVSELDAAQLENVIAIYIWGGGEEDFVAAEAALMASYRVKSWIILSSTVENPIIENLITAGSPICTAPISISRNDLRHLICLAERNARICVGPVCNEKNALAAQMLKEAKLSNDLELLLRCLSNGLSNKEIARLKDCTEGAVKVHIRQLMLKLGVTNRTQAAVLAIRAGLSNGSALIERIAQKSSQSSVGRKSKFEAQPFAAPVSSRRDNPRFKLQALDERQQSAKAAILSSE